MINKIFDLELTDRSVLQAYTCNGKLAFSTVNKGLNINIKYILEEALKNKDEKEFIMFLPIFIKELMYKKFNTDILRLEIY